MHARKQPQRIAHGWVLVLFALLGVAPQADAQSSISITERDRDSHVVGERVGVEVVLEVGAWPATPAPGGTIRIGDPAHPTADCVIPLPAQPPLGCLWDSGVPGTYTLTAVYSGDSNYAPAVSQPVAHEILSSATPERVSLPDVAVPDRNASQPSRHAVASADGRWVAYLSADARLLSTPAPMSGGEAALLFDRHAGRTRRLGAAPGGAAANRVITDIAMSGNGEVILFRTTASNIDPADDATSPDWFVVGRDTPSATRVPALRVPDGNGPEFRPALSFDGRYVAFTSARSDLVGGDTNGLPDVFRLDRNDGSVALVSRTIGGGVAGGFSGHEAISADGRYVAFSSSSPDLVAGDTNLRDDVFVRDMVAASTERVSVANGGGQVVANSGGGLISADGRVVAFWALDGFAAGDSDGLADVFLRDRLANTTTWASAPSAINATGAINAFSISANGSRTILQASITERLYLYDGAAQTAIAFGAPAGGFAPIGLLPRRAQLTADGRSVVFDTGWNNLVPDDRNLTSDVFFHDFTDARTARVSSIRMTGAGTGFMLGPAALSDDAALVAFGSAAGNLVPSDANNGIDFFVRDRLAARTRLASRTAGGTPSYLGAGFDDVGISGNGRFVVFASSAPDLAPNDGLDASDVFLFDRDEGSVRRLSSRPDGQASSGSFTPAISRDGRWVVFRSLDPVLGGPQPSSHPLWVHDVMAGTNNPLLPSGAIGPSSFVGAPRVSGDGRYVVFESTASSLVDGDTNGVSDIFVRDRVSAVTRRISVAADGTQADGESVRPEISADGRSVAFVSRASNLVTGDLNGHYDVFVVDLPSGAIRRVSTPAGDPFTPPRPGLSADGRYVVFQSHAQDFGAAPQPAFDAYVRDRSTGVLRRVVARTGATVTIPAGTPSISADGLTVSFVAASTLAAGGARYASDVFVAANPIDLDGLFVDGFETQ